MSNELALPAAFGASASALAALDPNWNPSGPSEFSGGIRRGFAVISLKGKTWRIIYQGVDRPVTRPDDGTAAAALQVIVVASTPDLSKVYYKGEYVEGSDSPPDCFSNDGIKPDRSVQTPVNPMCATCPMNVWGSKTTAQGKATKACSDSKRLAILPLPQPGVVGDDALDIIDNEAYGGAMMLRLPAASLAEIAAYDSFIRSAGFPMYAVGTQLSFDMESAFPKVMFKPVRPLTPDEFAVVMEYRDSPVVRDMLGISAPQGAAQAPAQPQAQTVDPAVEAAAQAKAKAEAEARAQAQAKAEAEARVQAQAKAAAEAKAAADALAEAERLRAAAGPVVGAAPAASGGRRARRATNGGDAPAAAPVAVLANPTPAPVAATAPAAATATIAELDDVLNGILGGAT